jgi:2,4-dienoyl-CoA reductase-like NADH-dependent reductase (Old Yellow Enzyme family)
MRSPAHLIQQTPVCPSANQELGARELTSDEIQQLKEDFIVAAHRAQKSGYDGVEVHGAHGYILTQFLSSAINKRTDHYGGSLENRARLLFEIVNGIRTVCGEKFMVGVRLSPEGFGLKLMEIIQLCERFIHEATIDFLDISLWDVKKLPEEKEYQNQHLLHYFTQLERKNVRLTVAGKIRNGEDVQYIIDSGVDFATIGRSAILHHDFPKKVLHDAHFQPIETPVSREYLHNEGLGENFIAYMSRWPNFVQ